MLWVYGHYKFVILSVRGSTLDVNIRQILTSIKSVPALKGSCKSCRFHRNSSLRSGRTPLVPRRLTYDSSRRRSSRSTQTVSLGGEGTAKCLDITEWSLPCGRLALSIILDRRRNREREREAGSCLPPVSFFFYVLPKGKT